MADLRNGSTVGNSPIVNMKMLNKFIPHEKISDWNNKMNKYESPFTQTSGFDSIFASKDKNGFYEYNNCTPDSTIYNYGSIFSLNSGNYGLQLLAPEKENASSGVPALYFRTRLQSTNRAWNRIATYAYVDSRVNTRLALAGGTMSGVLKSSADFRTTARAFINIKASGQSVDTQPAITLALGDHDTGFNWIQDGQFHIFSNGIAVAHIASTGINILKNLSVDGKAVWHSGNFDPNTKISKSTLLTEKTDLNNVLDEGHYRVCRAVNIASTIIAWAYIEVIRHDSTWVLQKAYNYEGTLAYYRTHTSNGWGRWMPLGGIWKKVVSLTAANWAQDTNTSSGTYGMYYSKLTHNASSNNIVAVSFIDSGNSSVEFSYDVNDTNTITLWCNEATVGTVRILGYL